MHKSLTGSVARRLSIALLTGIIVLLCAYGYRAHQQDLGRWHAAAENQASAVLRVLAAATAEDMRNRNYEAARSALQRLVQQLQPDTVPGGMLIGVRTLQLHDSAGNAVASLGPRPAPAQTATAAAGEMPFLPTSASTAEAPGREGAAISLTAPVLYAAEPVGSLSIVFDTSSLERLLHHLSSGYVIYLTAAICTALLLTLVFAHWIMLPLGQAIKVLPRIGAGGIALPALTARRDEYAELGRAIEFADRRIHEASDRLQAQQDDLLETQSELNRFKNTLDQTLDCVFMFKPENLQFFYTNAGALRQVGFSAAELNNMTVLDIKPEFDEARFRSMIAPLINGERDAITFETVHRHKNGSLVPVEIFLQYIAPADEPARFVAIVRDISERKRVEQELEQHRQHLEELVEERSATIREQVSIIDQTHDSVVTTDLDGVVTSWNRGSERLFGVPSRHAIGRHISFVYPDDEHAYLQQQVIAPLKRKGEHEAEVRMQRADGCEFFAHVSLSMLYDRNDAPKGMVGYSVDITERKRREALLQSTTADLRASNRELESFCYTVSHDLRAPLRAIHGFSQILSEDYEQTLDDAGKDYLRRIRNGADNMGRIIDDLLELSRVARREMNFGRVNLSALAERVITELRESDPQRDIEVHIQPGLFAMGDEGLLHILMENLLGNAWKYTGRTPDARLEFGRQGNDTETVFFVRDNGAGFDMRYADKLFGTFERLHLASDFPGTGIGLATVHRIVERHGGTISGEGQPGQGACFSFSLPGKATAEREAASA